MKIVATVNGIVVFSDMTLTCIKGTQLIFADGSWCDVRTNEVESRGSGKIQIGNRVGKSEKSVSDKTGHPYRSVADADTNPVANQTRGPDLFPSDRLVITDLSATLQIDVWDKAGMEFLASGPSSAVKSISVSCVEKTLTIAGSEEKPPARSSRISGINIQSGRGGSSVTITGSVCGQIAIDGNTTLIGSSAEDVRVFLKVPRGSSIHLEGDMNDAEIGDVDGDLILNLIGNGDIRCGRMRRAEITVLCNSDVRISEVNGPLNATLTGTGDVKVKSGKATDLNVRITGTGDFKFGGMADTAVLVSSGTGDITVSKVKAKPIIRCTGTGRISVG